MVLILRLLDNTDSNRPLLAAGSVHWNQIVLSSWLEVDWGGVAEPIQKHWIRVDLAILKRTGPIGHGHSGRALLVHEEAASSERTI